MRKCYKYSVGAGLRLIFMPLGRSPCDRIALLFSSLCSLATARLTLGNVPGTDSHMSVAACAWSRRPPRLGVRFEEETVFSPRS